jgi:hypothetical protein
MSIRNAAKAAENKGLCVHEVLGSTPIAPTFLVIKIRHIQSYQLPLNPKSPLGVEKEQRLKFAPF